MLLILKLVATLALAWEAGLLRKMLSLTVALRSTKFITVLATIYSNLLGFLSLRFNYLGFAEWSI
jgi:hypothetical protein